MASAKGPADFLPEILRQAKAAAGRSATTRALAEVLGEELAQHCRVVSEAKGRLLVDVDSAPLFSELQAFRREELRQALNLRLPERKFAELRFRMNGTGHV